VVGNCREVSLVVTLGGGGIAACTLLISAPDLRPRSCMRSLPSDRLGAGTTLKVRSRFAFTSESSSYLQLLICLSDGMRSLLNSCVATNQFTSGGGGVGTRARVEVPGMDVYSFDGSTTFALNERVGDQKA